MPHYFCKLVIKYGVFKRATIDIYNLTGMSIAHFETNEATFRINVSALPSGTFFIRIAEGNYSSVKSFVKE
ncbi:MAG: T9SS type A sorting domain-containing protein [Lentimicrobiaceae bacterium]|nr:T9SS type A sorting domain-containing protein [Lentimicrobiaceae bacterium]